MRKIKVAPALLLALGVAASASPAWALRGANSPITRPDVEGYSPDAAVAGSHVASNGALVWDQAPRSLAKAWARFKASHGPDFRAGFDPRTGVPRRIFGPGISAPGAVADAAVAEQFSRAFFAEIVALVAPGADVSDFELVSNDLDAGIRSVGFIQRVGALRVRGGQVSFRFKNDRLYVIGSEALPNVPRVLSEPVAWDFGRDLTSAVDWVSRDYGTATLRSIGELAIVPVNAVPTENPDYTVASSFEVDAGSAGRFRVFVDTATGEPILREQLFHFAESSVLLHVPERSPSFGPRFDAPAALATINVEGAAVKTDVAGAFSWTGTDPTDIQLFLDGDRVRVLNDVGDEAILAISATDATPYIWDASQTITVDSQLTTFVHAATVREYAKSFAPTLGFLSAKVQATVNIDDICNAYSDGTTINFYRAGNGCENTGRIADVVYHEYGHSIHAHAIIEGVGAFEGALSEGQSDYLAATITGDPGTARGFFNDTEPLRDLDPPNKENHWPEDLKGEVHEDGIIIGQTLWDLRKALIAKYGDAEGVAAANNLYYQGIRRASDIPTMYVEILAADDDDGDLTNGTPNVCEINQAFGLHGLRAIGQSTVTPGVLPPTMEGYKVEVEITGLYPQCQGDGIVGGQVAWRDRSAPNAEADIPLTIEGSKLSATIPMQPADTVVEYKVEVDLEGQTIEMPKNAADPYYQFYIGDVVPLYCTDFEADPTLNGWTHGLEAGEATDGADDWTWGKAKGDATNGDAPTAYSGKYVFGNDLSKQANFNGLYQSNKTNWAKSPVIDTQGYKIVRLQYRRWLTVEDGQFDQASILGNDIPLWQNLDSDQGDNSDTQHLDVEWRFQDVDLSSTVVDGKVQVTYKLASDGGLEFGGWTLDDFCVVGVASNDPCADGSCGGQGGAGGGDTGGAGGSGGAGNNPTGGDDDGCGCATAGSPAPGVSWLVGLGALAAVVSRRSARKSRRA
ncbi:MAG: MYXO-CTERM sorting domain-containing protein [Polyangiaceae bacterium]